MVKDPTISNFSSRRRVEVFSVLQTFFNKIDRQEVTLDDIARLVLLSKATARAANSRRRGAQAKLGGNRVRREETDPNKPVVRRRRRGRPKLLERSREDEFLNRSAAQYFEWFVVAVLSRVDSTSVDRYFISVSLEE